MSTHEPENFDQRAARLSAATRDIVAPAGLGDAVMAALTEPQPGMLEGVRRVGAIAVAIASFAAAASLVASFTLEDRVDADILATFPEVEPFE